jgi:hypothetical protein
MLTSWGCRTLKLDAEKANDSAMLKKTVGSGFDIFNLILFNNTQEEAS